MRSWGYMMNLNKKNLDIFVHKQKSNVMTNVV